MPNTPSPSSIITTIIITHLMTSIRYLTVRACEHMGISFRTKHPVAKPSQSANRDHFEQCGHCDITVNKFKILGSAREVIDMRILESIFIFKRRPLLNNMQSAFPLLILSK